MYVQVQEDTHTGILLLLWGLSMTNVISLHVITQPKPNSNNNLKATSCPLKTSPIFHLVVDMWILVPTVYKNRQGKGGRERELERVDVTILPIMLYTFLAHTHTPIRHLCMRHTVLADLLPITCDISLRFFWPIYTQWHVFVLVLRVVYWHASFDVSTSSMLCRRCV